MGGILRNGGDPSNRGNDFEMGGWYPFTDYVITSSINESCTIKVMISIKDKLNI